MADSSSEPAFIIRGVTRSGQRFRPSDWAERLAGAFSVVGPDNRTSYSPYVQPSTIEGTKCVTIDKRLKTADPLAYRFLQEFARSNDLVTDNAD